ncbi:MAG: hypothetical protein ABEI77_07495 [Halorientalis sp.]
MKAKKNHPDENPQEIAELVDCSEGYARDILDEYDTAQLDTDSGSSSSNSSGGTGNGLIDLLLLPFYFAVWMVYISWKFVKVMFAFFFAFLKAILPPY